LIKNRIVTRGFSTTQHLLVTRGYVPTLAEQIIQGAKDVFRSIVRGRPRREHRRREEEFVIRVSLVSVNGRDLTDPITGRIKAILEPNERLFIKVIDKIKVGVVESIKNIFVKARLKWKR